MATKNVRETHNRNLHDPEVAAEYLKEAIESRDKAVILKALRSIATAYDVAFEGAAGALKGSVTHYDEPTEPVWPTSESLVKGIGAENLHKEINTGNSVGREVIPAEEDLLEGMTFYKAHGDEAPRPTSKELGDSDDDEK